MPPKNKKKETPRDERLQAVVLTDTFQKRFMPLTNTTPRCLLPLANVPLIEYTFEFLANAGVSEVYLMCKNGAEQVQEYVDKSKWGQSGLPFKTTVIMLLELQSVGDAMRDVDNRGLVLGDFLLVLGDVVTNMDFKGAWAFHQQRKQEDRDYIATMVLKQAGPLHRLRSKDDLACFMVDNANGRCVYYQDVPNLYTQRHGAHGRRHHAQVQVDPELLDLVDELVVHNDLIDCCIDICTPHVPALFQDNFDYQHLRSDFLKGVLLLDLLMKTIYCYVLEHEYAARVCNWQTYHAVLQDVVARWCYPVVPDSNMYTEDGEVTVRPLHIYQGQNVVLAQLCTIGPCTVVGSGSRIGEGSQIEGSVIGANVTIGAGVEVRNLYIFDGAVLHDGCKVDTLVVAGGVVINKLAVVGRDAVLGAGVTVGEGVVIKPSLRVVAAPIQLEYDGEEAFVPEQVCGAGVGYLYKSDDERESDEELEDSDEHNRAYHQISVDFQHLELLDDELVALTVALHTRRHRRRRLLVFDTDFDEADLDDGDNFEREAIATMERAVVNDHDMDTAVLELNTLRMSMNASYQEVRATTTMVLLNRINEFVSTGTLTAPAAVKKVMDQWGSIFRRQAFDSDDRRDLLQAFQDKCGDKLFAPNQAVYLFKAVQWLYELDICGEEDIIEWWNESTPDEGDDELVLLRKSLQMFVNWLETADEESD